LRVAGPGESLPLASLVGTRSLITDAVTLTDLRAFVIPAAAFLDFCKWNPGTGLKLYQVIGELLALRYTRTLEALAEALGVRVTEPALWANV
jgi:hypothetical protein